MVLFNTKHLLFPQILCGIIPVYSDLSRMLEELLIALVLADMRIAQRVKFVPFYF